MHSKQRDRKNKVTEGRSCRGCCEMSIRLLTEAKRKGKVVSNEDGEVTRGSEKKAVI